MSLLSNFNNSRVASDPSYAWETADSQAIIAELRSLKIELVKLNKFLNDDLTILLLAIHNKLQ